jgi:hypothetical protein
MPISLPGLDAGVDPQPGHGRQLEPREAAAGRQEAGWPASSAYSRTSMAWPLLA